MGFPFTEFTGSARIFFGPAAVPNRAVRICGVDPRRRAETPPKRDGQFGLSFFFDASQELEHNPGDAAARDAYNFAIARVFGALKEAKLDPWTQSLRVPSPGGEFVLTRRPDSRKQWNPALYEFTPADQFDIAGAYVTERQQKDGLGAPLVAVGKEMNGDAAKDFSMRRIFYGVTAIIDFDGSRAVVAFEDPLATERVTFGGHGFPLAADFTGPEGEVPLIALLDRRPGHVHPVGDTVNVPDANYGNTIGAPMLGAFWKDPDFSANQRAFYYVRVIEIPTPRWTAFDAKFYGVKMSKEVPMTTTERAYTSPVWYTPGK